jgi:hypothetical protein
VDSQIFVEGGRFVANISSGEQLACANWLDRFGDGNAVHVNWIADFEIVNCKFVFGRNVKRPGRNSLKPIEAATADLRQRDQHVVAAVKL